MTLKCAELCIKRVADLLLAVVALVLLAPLLLATAALVKLTSPGPVLFTQHRVGFGKRVFRIYKFRTMSVARDDAGNPLPREARITRVGRLLRLTSVDELPQLINILRGDMSFVGPRPLEVEDLPGYTTEQRRRYDVTPGMGSYADVKLSRTITDWDVALAYDVWYVDHWSLWLDVVVFVRIATMVLLRQGAEQGARGSTPEFWEGSNAR